MGAEAKHLSPFVEAKYTADRNPVKHYHRQAAKFLSVVYDWDEDYLLELMPQIFIPNENGFKEAKFRVFQKNKYGDRVPVVMPAREFFSEVEEKNYHLSPSLVAYKNSDEEQCINAIGTEIFIDFRRLYKHKRSEVPKGSEQWKAFNEIQNALKIFNNAQSGAMSSSGTPLYNKSGHTTLTSTCRAITSTANLVNERLITGNRLFLSYNRTLESMIAQLAYADRNKIQAAIDLYGLAYADVDQVFDMVRRCTRYYWYDEQKLSALYHFLLDLNPLELTILLCSMDLRGLYTTNPGFIKEFFREWCDVPEVPEDANDPKPENGDYKNLCITKLPKDVSSKQINHLNSYHVALEVKWRPFIEAFLKSEIPPTGLFDAKEMVRETVLTSDTDSSIYSVDTLIEDIIDGPESFLRVNGVLTYFIRNIAIDQHARLSKNMNVSRKYQYRLNMKNEFLFGSYVTTSMSKHYFALQLMVEGVLNAHPDLEMKGVHLKGIKIALKVREFTAQLMRDILDALYDRRKLDAATLLNQIGNIERELIKDVEEGGYAWLTKNGIKDASSYSTPESSIYFYHEMWTQVFAEKYGDAPELPYKAFKVNIDLSNKTKIKRYFAEHRSDPLVARLEAYISSRDSLTSVYIPVDMIAGMGGIPKEILPIVDIRLILSQNLSSIYAILETLGLYIMNRKTSRLVSDEH